MVQAISEITVNQGIDPADAVLIGGGGAAGLNSTLIARRLGCPKLLIPETGAALSAYGAVMSDLTTEFRSMFFTTSEEWDLEGVNKILAGLEARCQSFIDGPGAGAAEHTIEFGVEARYASQVWEIDVPLRANRFKGDGDLKALVEDFHAVHKEIFAINDPDSIVEMVSWTASVSCRLRGGTAGQVKSGTLGDGVVAKRLAYFEQHGEIETSIQTLNSIDTKKIYSGPAIIETEFTTIVVDPQASFQLTENRSVVISP
jgi:N-methylhydantoinase A